MIGHLLGAAGALEAMVCVKAMSRLGATADDQPEEPDPECDLDYVPNRPSSRVRVALSNSLGFGGHNATLVFQEFAG